MNENRLQQIREQIAAHGRRLQLREVQAATQGQVADPAITIDIEDIRAQVLRLEQEMVALKRGERLVFLCDEILSYARKSLDENQKILAEFFGNTTKREATYQSMSLQYNNQENRGIFGKWNAELEKAANEENNPQIKSLIYDLQSSIHELRTLFYDYNYDTNTHTKYRIVNSLKPNSNTSDTQAVAIASVYLNSLRELVDKIGYITQHLQSSL